MTKSEQFDYEHEAQANSRLSRLLSPLRWIPDLLALGVAIWERIFGED